MVQTVTGNLVEVSSAVRIKIFNGVYSDSNMKLLVVDPNLVESTWEDDDLVVQKLTLPVTSKESEEKELDKGVE
jgi:hypothetical protein